jgi:adenosylhomocysteine nucleosidase
MVLAFLAPMPVEMRPLANWLSLGRSEDGLRKGRLGDKEVVATTTGIGTRLAARTTERLLESAGASVEHVIVVGIAGGVDPELGIGDLVVPSVVVASSTGNEYHPTPLGPLPSKGKLLTTEGLQTGPEILAQHLKEHVTAVDMETAAIAEICERHHVPWTVFRAISDTLADGIVDASMLGMVRADGTADTAATLRYILKRPWRIPRLARLGRDTKLATTVAATAAIHACRQG